MAVQPSTSTSSPPPPPDAITQPASRLVLRAHQYTFDQLAGLYNQARVDYIVPMPMNGKRMAEYVRYYDVDLSASFVSINDEKLESGIGMLGLRGDRSWITRLGVLPERRGHHVGQSLMESLLEESSRRGVRRVQLEVIVGNKPAHQLFTKLGFETLREVLVLRRPPGAPEPELVIPNVKVTEIDDTLIPTYLAQRTDSVSWIDETPSILNAGSLRGVQVELSTGESAWAIFQRSPFQLTHFAFSSNALPDAMQAVLHHIHGEFVMQDTKIENFAADHPLWHVFQKMGYIEVFRRTEMHLIPK